MHNSYYKNNTISVNGLKWILKKNLANNFDEIKKIENMPEIIKEILYKRELFDMDIRNYLRPSFDKQNLNPYRLHDMEKAVEFFFKAIIYNEKIGILGDYDVDGATSSAIIYNYLTELKLENIEVYIPDREKDGYGLSHNAINFFKKKKVKLILCLDCGTNDDKCVAAALATGIKTIIIDHHEQKSNNRSIALINPKKKNDISNLNYLATVGLVFLFILALDKFLENKRFFNTNKSKPNIKKYLDLVALGTICDMVPLKNLNRFFVKEGILKINKKINLGIKVLIEKLNIKKTLDASDLGFYLGPCINAPGRVGESSLGFKILTSKNESFVRETVDAMIQNNLERKTLEKISCTQAINKIISKKLSDDNLNTKFILLQDTSWHPGIIGIIASRLTKKYNIPSIVISLKEKNAKGSIRSIKGINAVDIIDFLKKNNSILNGGGHKMAGGFTTEKKSLNNINASLHAFFSDISINKNNFLEIDAILDLHVINPKLIENIKNIGPFGQENEEPLVVLNNLRPTFIKKVGKTKKHIFCVLEDSYGESINAMVFNHDSTAIGKAIYQERPINIAGKLELYLLEGKIKTPQIIIEDILIL